MASDKLFIKNVILYVCSSILESFICLTYFNEKFVFPNPKVFVLVKAEKNVTGLWIFYTRLISENKTLQDINFNYENEAMRVLDSEKVFFQQHTGRWTAQERDDDDCRVSST